MAQHRWKFLQAVSVLVAAFLIFKYGIQPPMPFSLLVLYMAITLLAVLVYVSSDSDSWRAFVAPIWAVPVLIGYYAYSQAAAQTEAPFELRAVHPAPPPSISFRGKEINLQATDTP